VIEEHFSPDKEEVKKTLDFDGNFNRTF